MITDAPHRCYVLLSSHWLSCRSTFQLHHVSHHSVDQRSCSLRNTGWSRSSIIKALSWSRFKVATSGAVRTFSSAYNPIFWCSCPSDAFTGSIRSPSHGPCPQNSSQSAADTNGSPSLIFSASSCLFPSGWLIATPRSGSSSTWTCPWSCGTWVGYLSASTLASPCTSSSASSLSGSCVVATPSCSWSTTTSLVLHLTVVLRCWCSSWRLQSSVEVARADLFLLGRATQIPICTIWITAWSTLVLRDDCLAEWSTYV